MTLSGVNSISHINLSLSLQVSNQSPSQQGFTRSGVRAATPADDQASPSLEDPMTSETNKEKKGPPQIVKLNKALALAEKWVCNMSELPAEDESFETQSRPARLGLGAKVARTSTFVPDDPLERKLYYKLNAQKKTAAKLAEELSLAAVGGDDDDEDNEDSRTKVLGKKKRATNPLNPPLGKKKRK